MDKKQEILMAAFDIFCEKGYHLSVAELAGAVKIKTPSLYSHFASKDEIIELVVRDEIERYYAYLHKWMLKIEGLYCKEAMGMRKKLRKNCRFFMIKLMKHILTAKLRTTGIRIIHAVLKISLMWFMSRLCTTIR